MELSNFEAEVDNFKIFANVVNVGEDIVIIVRGGKSHTGAVGISYPTASLIEKGKTTITTSVITLPGHKDDIIARMFSEKISRALNKNVVAIAGIHFDNITKSEIEKIVQCCLNLCDEIINNLKDKI